MVYMEVGTTYMYDLPRQLSQQHNSPLYISPANVQWLQAVVISKNFNKGGSRDNHAHSLGVALLQPRPCFHKWKHDSLV